MGSAWGCQIGAGDYGWGGVGRLVFRMFMGVTAPVPWVPAYAGTTVRGEGVLVWDDGSGGFRACPLGSGSGAGMTGLG